MSVKIEQKGYIYIVIISRPEARNAVDGPTAEKLAQAFQKFDEDENARVAVLWGEGGNFCAGADLKAIFQGKNANRVERDGDGPMGPTRMLLSKPVIAAISGYAVAGGLELALWCDLRVVERDAVLGVFSRRWGVPLIDGGTVRLPRLIGLSRALDLILTGRPISGEEAYQIGLANYLVEKGKARQKAEELAEKIAQFPQTCLRNDRLSAYQQFDFNLQDALKNEFELGLKSLASPEMMEGVKKFIEGKGRSGKFE